MNVLSQRWTIVKTLQPASSSSPCARWSLSRWKLDSFDSVIKEATTSMKKDLWGRNLRAGRFVKNTRPEPVYIMKLSRSASRQGGLPEHSRPVWLAEHLSAGGHCGHWNGPDCRPWYYIEGWGGRKLVIKSENISTVNFICLLPSLHRPDCTGS